MFIPEDYAQINLKFTGDAAPTGAEVTFGADVSGTAGDPSSIAAAVSVAYQDAGLDGISVGALTLSTILVKFGPNDTGPSFELPASHGGDLSGQGVTPNTSLLVKKSTAVGGRRGRGRIYWPGIEEGVIDAFGNIDPTAQSTFQGLFDGFRTALSSGDVPMVVLHADTGFTPHLVEDLIVQNVAATQRRRLRS